MRLGDFDALEIKLDAELMDISDYLNIHEQIKDIIDNAPIIIKCSKTSEGLPLMDLRPRPQGEWKTTDAYPHKIYCGKCFKTYAQEDWEVWKDGSLPRNFCPNCGADMRDKEDVFTRKEELSKEESEWLIDFITKEDN